MTNYEMYDLVYKRISLRGTQTIEELRELFDLSYNDIEEICEVLYRRGLIKRDKGTITVVQWWKEPYLEVFINPPWLEDSEFKKYCTQLDALADNMKSTDYFALRPFKNETAIEIVLAATALAAGGVIAKAALSNIGKRLGEFVGETIGLRTQMGINKIEIKATQQLKNGTSITFTVTGTEPKKITKVFDEINEKLDKLRQDQHAQLILNTKESVEEAWRLEIKK